MARPKTLKPSYCHHKTSGRAFVRLDGSTPIYLGKFGTQASRDKYDRLVGEWIAQGRATIPNSTDAKTPAGLSVAQLIAAFWNHAKVYYKNREGNAGPENFRHALRPLNRLYGNTPAADFGPLALKAVRAEVIKAKRVKVVRVEINPTTGKRHKVEKEIDRPGWARHRRGPPLEGYMNTGDGFSLHKSINSLVGDGWLAVLGCTELAVYLIYVRCANHDGIAWPGTMDIAAKLGHGTRNHVWVARQKLESRGLLQRLPDLEGKIRYRVCYPTAPESKAVPNRDQRTTKNHPRTTNRKKDDSGGGRGGDADAVETIWAAYPKKAGKPKGITAITKALARIANRPGMTNPTGWLLQRVTAYANLRKGQDPKFTKFAQGWFNDDRFDDPDLDAQSPNPIDEVGSDGWQGRALTHEQAQAMLAAEEVSQ